MFLDAGYTHRGKHPYAGTVTRGLRFLKRAQGEDGWFTKQAPDRSLADHLPPALALLLLCSARLNDEYRMSREPPQSRFFVIEDEALAPLRRWRDVDPGDDLLKQSVVVMAGMLFEKDEAFDAHLRESRNASGTHVRR